MHPNSTPQTADGTSGSSTTTAPGTVSSANAAITTKTGSDFIRQRVIEDQKSNRYHGQVHTRFPPEPNGYLHIGHAKAICTDFGVAEEFGGLCNLRFDDTNPAKEEQEYVDNIKFDVHWLGFDWGDRLFYASDYFGQLYEWALLLIRKGLAYVDDLSADEISKGRGTPTEPGVNSPNRNRSIEENVTLFEGMKAGKFKEGEHVLRAKIDMAHPNLTMRDPVMYRIKFDDHHRTGSDWCIYPMYDWAHGQSDAIEGVTHSLCTLEFENHRPLYEWFLEAIGLEHRPQQIEFSRLNLTYTMMSKRKLLEMVQSGIVDGWDDPRMPTLSGMRRRGYTPESIKAFVASAGLSRSEGMIELPMLEYFVRQDLNKRSKRLMAVLDPIKLVIDNYPEDKTEYMSVENNPESKIAGTRKVAFSKEVWIEREDFREVGDKKWYRLAPGATVRLKSAYYVVCTGCDKDETGRVVTVHATYEPASLGGGSGDGRKVKGTIHWVSTKHALDLEVRQYDTLFTLEDLAQTPEDKEYTDFLNPKSLVTLKAKGELAFAESRPGDFYQFLRQGYYVPDSVEFVTVGLAAANAIAGLEPSRPRLVFNRTVTLKDTWQKTEKK